MALSGKTVQLQPSDDEKNTVRVAIEVAHMSLTIKNMLDDLGEETYLTTPIPLHNVSTPVLNKIDEFCKYHVENPSDTTTKTQDNCDLCEWDQKFCSVDQATLFELILAANYLDIKSLLDATCKTVANMIKGKTPEEIRKTFNIKNDFTPEEEEKVRKENEWCEER